MYNVYIAKSRKTGHCYIGSAADVENRIKQHNSNQTRSTRNKGPHILVYKETLATKTEARKRENQLKKLKGNRQLKRLIENTPPSSSPV
ncbi:MAG: GIY-YIG nuclease family protein [Candidatus Omnitrophota bacterium]